MTAQLSPIRERDQQLIDSPIHSREIPILGSLPVGPYGFQRELVTMIQAMLKKETILGEDRKSQPLLEIIKTLQAGSLSKWNRATEYGSTYLTAELFEEFQKVLSFAKDWVDPFEKFFPNPSRFEQSTFGTRDGEPQFLRSPHTATSLREKIIHEMRELDWRRREYDRIEEVTKNQPTRG